MSEFLLGKIFWNIKFPHAARLFDKRGEIATHWRWYKGITDWRISHNKVTLRNKINSTYLDCGLQEIVVVMEYPDSYVSFSDLAIEYSTYILELLEIPKIERVGLRVIQIAKRKRFTLLVKKMKELYSLTDEDWRVFIGFPEDIGFPLILNFGSDKANFNCGPMKSEQLANYFESDEIKKRLPPVSIFMDIDIHRTEIEPTPNNYGAFCEEYMKSGFDRISKISNGFLNKYKGFK